MHDDIFVYRGAGRIYVQRSGNPNIFGEMLEDMRYLQVHSPAHEVHYEMLIRAFQLIFDGNGGGDV